VDGAPAASAGGKAIEAEDSSEPSFTPMLVTASVAALDCASPTDANLVAQCMADGLTARASLPALPLGRQRPGGQPGSAKAGSKSAALRHSAPAVPAKKRSSFLMRPLVSDRDVYPGAY
jgi:hypothetical protein